MKFTSDKRVRSAELVINGMFGTMYDCDCPSTPCGVCPGNNYSPDECPECGVKVKVALGQFSYWCDNCGCKVHIRCGISVESVFVPIEKMREDVI